MRSRKGGGGAAAAAHRIVPPRPAGAQPRGHFPFRSVRVHALALPPMRLLRCTPAQRQTLSDPPHTAAHPPSAEPWLVDRHGRGGPFAGGLATVPNPLLAPAASHGSGRRCNLLTLLLGALCEGRGPAERGAPHPHSCCRGAGAQPVAPKTQRVCELDQRYALLCCKGVDMIVTLRNKLQSIARAAERHTCLKA